MTDAPTLTVAAAARALAALAGHCPAAEVVGVYRNARSVVVRYRVRKGGPVLRFETTTTETA